MHARASYNAMRWLHVDFAAGFELRTLFLGHAFATHSLLFGSALWSLAHDIHPSDMYRSSYNGPRTTFSGSRRGSRGGSRRGYGGHDDLTRAMGRMSLGSSADVKIPPLSSFTFGTAEDAVAGRSVEAGERIGRAEDIPLKFPTTSAYLKVRSVHSI